MFRTVYIEPSSVTEPRAHLVWMCAAVPAIMDAAWSTFEIQSGRLEVTRWLFDAPLFLVAALHTLLTLDTVWKALGGKQQERPRPRNKSHND